LEIKIEEVLNEITYLDRVRVLINGEVYKPVDCPAELEEIDGTYVELKRDDSIILKFNFNEKIEQDIISPSNKKVVIKVLKLNEQ